MHPSFARTSNLGSTPRPAVRPRRALAALMAFGIVVATACTSDEQEAVEQVAGEVVAEDEGPGESPEAVDADLAGLTLSATTADPFDTVSVGGLGGGLEIGEVELFVRGAPLGLDTDIPVPVFADLDDPTDAVLSVPFHPGDPLGGGTVEVVFARDGAEGSPIELRITGLSPAPGAWNDFLDGFAEAIAREAEAFGTTAAELAATDFDDVPAELLPLKLAQSYLDDGTESSLAGIYDSERLDDGDRALLDAMSAAMNLGDSLMPVEDDGREDDGLQDAPSDGAPGDDEMIDEESSASDTNAGELVEGESNASGLDDADTNAGEPIGFRGPRRQRMDAILPTEAARACRPAGVTVDGPADLAAKLRRAQDWNIAPGGPVEKIFRDISTATTVGSFIPGIGWVIGAGGASFAALEAFHNGMAGLNPSKITSLDATIAIEEFREDFVIDGSWSGVKVIAESTGWDADAEVARVIFGAAGSAWSAASGLGALGGFASDLGSFLGGNKGIDHIRNSTDRYLSFCPEQWEVDVTGQPWSRASVVLDRFGVDDGRRAYWPLDLGMELPVEDILRIELDLRQFRNQMVSKDFPIRVNPIRVTPVETVIEVDAPMDVVPVRVQVRDAHDIDLEWNPGAGTWQGEAPQLVQADPAVWEYRHIAAIDEEAFPYVISARSTSSTGLRANGDPPRVATMTVRLRELIISPNPASTLTGGQVQFTVRDRNGNEVDVDWSATGGVIDANGLFTAGDEEGTFTVTAVVRDNPQRRSTATVEVADAECVVGTWRLQTQPFLDQIMALIPMDMQAVDLGGDYMLEFRADGTFEGRREAWTFGVTTPQGVARTRIDSVERGTWGVSGGNQLFIDETSSEVSVEATVEAAGQVMRLPSGPVDDAGISSGRGPYTCDADTLTISTTQEGRTITATLSRF